MMENAAILWMLVCVAFAAYGPRRDSVTWAILSIMACFSTFANYALFSRIQSDLEPLMYLAIELCTCFLLVLLCRSPLRLFMVACLVAASACHTLLYIDYSYGTSLIYDNYESYLLSITAIMTTSGFHGPILRSLHRLAERLRGAGGRDTLGHAREGSQESGKRNNKL